MNILNTLIFLIKYFTINWYFISTFNSGSKTLILKEVRKQL